MINRATIYFLIFLISFVFSTNATSQEKEIRVVISEGVGRDVNEAAQNAAENALTNVVGSFMDVNTTLEKKTQIQDGVKSQSKNIRRDIKEYSQGIIKSFEILEVKEQGLITVTAKVSVQIDDFRVYIKKLAEAEVAVDGGLFAQLKTEEKQKQNSAAILYEKILLPLVQGEGINFKIGPPKPLSQLGLTGTENFERAHQGKSIVGFTINTTTKDGFMENASNILQSISKDRVSLGNYEGHSLFNITQSMGSIGSKSGDVFIAIYESEPGSSSSNMTGTGYLINSAANELAGASAWTSFIATGDGKGQFYGERTTPTRTLQLEILDNNGKVLQRERVSQNNTSDSQRMVVVSRNDVRFSSPWSLLGGAYTGGWSYFLVRDSTNFILIVAIDEQTLKSAKSIVLKLI